jgi:hypothetical protein
MRLYTSPLGLGRPGSPLSQACWLTVGDMRLDYGVALLNCMEHSAKAMQEARS